MRNESPHIHALAASSSTPTRETRSIRGSTPPADHTEVFESALAILSAAGIEFEILIDTVGRAA
jgi:hypothetical protein